MASFFKKPRTVPIIISIVIAFIGIFTYLNDFTFIDFMEKKTLDLRFRHRGKIVTSSKVVLAVIDEKSLNKEGKWIWPRSKIAKLVTRLSESGAQVIAFDIIFDAPDNSEALQAIDNINKKVSALAINNKKLTSHLNRLKIQFDNDQRLADAIKNCKAKVVLGNFFQMTPDYTGNYDDNKLPPDQKKYNSSRYDMVRFSSRAAESMPIREIGFPTFNTSIISQLVDYSGFFNIPPDIDGVVRQMPAAIKFKDDLYAPLSIKTVQAYMDTTLSVNIETGYGIENVRLGDLSIPTNEKGDILINYRGDSQTFPHISVTDILSGNTADDIIRDKIVIVGATALGIYDMRATPFSEIFPGVEIHANIIDSILSKDFLYKPEYGQLIDIIAILSAALFLGLLLPKTGTISGAVAGISFFSGYIVLCQYLFSVFGWVLNLVTPLCVTVMVYVAITSYRYIAEERQKLFIKNAFSTYLAPAVVKQLMESPEKLNLGGEQREITAFFSDVQGFTSISEQLTPHDLVELLNEFLTEMTDVIFKYEGTVDKFEGDAIIAFFGAPNQMTNHAVKACMASIEMQKRLISLREKWKTEGKPELKMRIGLCSGPAVVGNMGSKNRMDYTMMGDTVNTAARLEGTNKIYGIYTLISETTQKFLGPNILTRKIDTINVVGKKEPVAVYQLIGDKEKIEEGLALALNKYAKGLAAYQKQDWDAAINYFKAAIEHNSEDGPSKTMLTRCIDYKNNPPGKNWNGSFTMSTK